MDILLTWGLLESVAFLDLGVVFREAYNTCILRIQSSSIDTLLILLHVEFEDRLFIPILKNRATRHKNLQLKIFKFLKKSNAFKGPPSHFYFNTRPLQTLVCMSDFSRLTGKYSNE
jgi:hypothetical protein